MLTIFVETASGPLGGAFPVATNENERLRTLFNKLVVTHL